MAKKEWPVVRLGDACEINPRTSFPKDLAPEICFVPMESVSTEGHLEGIKLVPTENVRTGYTRFKNHDVLVAKITPCFENGKTAIADVDSEYAAGSTEFHVFRPSETLDAEYLHYFLRTQSLRTAGETNMRGTSGHRRVPDWVFRNALIPLPPLYEQRRITRSLDHVEELLWKTELQISNLADAAKNVVKDLVSIGGETRRLDEIGSISTGATPSRKVPENFIGEIPWVKTTEVSGVVIDRTEEHISENALDNTSCHLNRAGSSIVAMYGQGSTRGRVGFLGIEAATNQACAVITPSDPQDDFFVFKCLDSDYERLRNLGRGGTQPNLNLSLVRSFQIPWPPSDVRDSVTSKLRAIEALEEELRHRRALIQELQSSLTTRAFQGEL